MAKTTRKTAEEKRWERESDLRALQEAEKVKSDPARFRGAQREAAAQQRALAKITKKR